MRRARWLRKRKFACVRVLACVYVRVRVRVRMRVCVWVCACVRVGVCVWVCVWRGGVNCPVERSEIQKRAPVAAFGF